MEKPTEADEDSPSPKGVEANAAPDTALEDRVSEEEDPQETDARVMEVRGLVNRLFREEAGRGWESGRKDMRELAEEIRWKKLLPPRLCLQRYCSRVTESQSAAFCSGCLRYAPRRNRALRPPHTTNREHYTSTWMWTQGLYARSAMALSIGQSLSICALYARSTSTQTVLTSTFCWTIKSPLRDGIKARWRRKRPPATPIRSHSLAVTLPRACVLLVRPRLSVASLG